MVKKAFVSHPPTPVRQNVPFHRQGPARSARRRVRSLTSADGRESVSAQCLRGEAYFVPYVEPLRFTPRWIKRGTFVNVAEMVRRLCQARTKLEGFFNILLSVAIVLPRQRAVGIPADLPKPLLVLI